MKEIKGERIESVSYSPSFNEMSFPEAIKKVIEGEKIHKLEWKDRNYYAFLKDGFLCLHKTDGKIYQWIINDGDLMGKDYIII